MRIVSGRRAFLELLRQEGVKYIFGNPGTTELPLMDGLVDYADITYILALQEGVAIGAADGYAQASDKLGVVNVHVAPGLGNAMGMLYDAYRAQTPLLVTAGQQDQRMQLGEPLLWSDLVDLARPFVKWAYEVRTLQELPVVIRRAIKVALTPPTGSVFVSLPMDVLYDDSELDIGSPSTPLDPRIRAPRAALENAATVLSQAHNPVMVVGQEVARSHALQEMVTVAELLGAKVFSDTTSNMTSFPSDHPLYQGPLVRQMHLVRAALEGHDLLFAVGASVFTFSVPGQVEPLPPGVEIVHLHPDPWEIGKVYPVKVGLIGDPKPSLAELAELLRSKMQNRQTEVATRLAAAKQAKAQARESIEAMVAEVTGKLPMSPVIMLKTLSEILPPETVIVDESLTSGTTLHHFFVRRDPKSYFALRGGGIGWGLPAALGVSLALPDRPIVAIVGEGSAMYTNQSLWTAAHYKLPIIYVICNNGGYLILKRRLHAYQGAAAKQQKYIGFDLTEPEIGFVDLAHAMGVPAERVEKPEALEAAIQRALNRSGPSLIDVMLERSITPGG